MNIRLNSDSIEKYFGYLTKLDLQAKKQLIVKLTESIDEKAPEKAGIERLFGAWEDERSAEEMIEDIRNSRTHNRNIEGFE